MTIKSGMTPCEHTYMYTVYKFARSRSSKRHICEVFSSARHAAGRKLLRISTSMCVPYCPWKSLIISSSGSVWLTRWLSGRVHRSICPFDPSHSSPLPEVDGSLSCSQKCSTELYPERVEIIPMYFIRFLQIRLNIILQSTVTSPNSLSFRLLDENFP
jgi:hypothetical protein